MQFPPPEEAQPRLKRRAALRRVIAILDDVLSTCEDAEADHELRQRLHSARRRAAIQLLAEVHSGSQWPFETGARL